MRASMSIVFGFFGFLCLSQPACLVADTDCESDDDCDAGRTCQSGACVTTGGEGASSGSGGNGGSNSPMNVPPECVADELNGTWQAQAVFNFEPGTLESVTVTFANAQLTSFDGMSCTPKVLEVAPDYPGCEQGWNCGPCSCWINVPGFGENLWTVKCSDPLQTWQNCGQYKYVEYELGPYDGSSPGSGGSGGTASCGDCKSCYDDCSYSCDGYSGSCVTTCMASCDKCCSWS